MSDFTLWWNTGGSAMYLIAALDLLGLGVVGLTFALALYARFSGKATGAARIVAIAAFLGCAIPLCAGVLGHGVAQYQLRQALKGVDAATAQSLQAAGEAESEVPLRFGGVSTLCCGLPALFVLLLAPRRRAAWEKALDDTKTSE